MRCAPRSLLLLMMLLPWIGAAEAPVAREVAIAFEKLGRRPPARDHALDRAAAVLAAAVLLEGPSTVGNSRRVADEVSRAGGADPHPRALLVRADTFEAALKKLRLHPSLTEAPATHLGLGTFRSGITTAVVAILVSRVATVEPFPREVPRAGRWARNLCARIEPPYRDAQVVITRPEGQVDQVPVQNEKQARVCARVTFPTEGLHRMEVMVHGPRGPEVAALFDVRVGEGSARTTAPRGRPSDPPEHLSHAEARAAILVEMNVLRASQGAGPLAADPALDALAQAYSERMATEGFFGHVSPDGSTLRSRASEAGYAYRTLGENLGAAGTALAAHETITDSPAHRGNLLNTSFTRVGIGIAKRIRSSGTEIIVTEVFAEPALEVSPSAAPESKPRDDGRGLIEAVARHRSAAGLAPLARNKRLDTFAQEHIDALYAARTTSLAGSTDQLHERIFRSITVGKVAVDLVILDAPAQLPSLKNLLRPRFTQLGVGWVRGDSQRFGPDKLWVLLIYTEPRTTAPHAPVR